MELDDNSDRLYTEFTRFNNDLLNDGFTQQEILNFMVEFMVGMRQSGDDSAGNVSGYLDDISAYLDLDESTET